MKSTTNVSNTILGLDLGTSSIGWALIQVDSEGNPESIVATGVRIFSEPVDPKTRVPKNQARQVARSMRKRLRRRRYRREKLATQLIAAGLLPVKAEERSNILTNLEAFDPYCLRAEGLDRKLSPFEFGRALYHLNQRRGFQSNRKAKVDKEEGIVKGNISCLRDKLSGFRTLGEFLFKQERKRNKFFFNERYTERAMFKAEYAALWSAQAPFYPEILTEALRSKFYRTMFFQRPLKSQKHLVGRCSLEPSRKRCHVARLQFQEFRLLQKLNDIRIRNPISREWRVLRDDERRALIEVLEASDLTWSKLRKVLKLHSNETINFEDAGEDRLKGNRTNRAFLESPLKSWWLGLPDTQKNQLVEDLLTIETDEALLRRAVNFWKLDSEGTRQLLEIELESSYGMLSLKAVSKLLPQLRNGVSLETAKKCLNYGVDSRAMFAVPLLPVPPSLRNPVVNRALHQTRQVVNAIIRKYGKPTEIRIEMAKDLRMGRKALEELNKELNRRRRLNESARAELKQDFEIFRNNEPNMFDLQKYLLWKECKYLCPYSGVTISREMLFSPEVEIEHIIPFSRCLDDSYQNKTLALASANRDKGNRTPYEMFNGNTQAYSEVLQRIEEFSYQKRKRFELQEVVFDDFASRQLNDTRYICVEVRRYVEQLGCRVGLSKGQLTAAMRRSLGLNSILSTDGEKTRADHRHHAVDALVTALVDFRLLHEASVRAKQREDLHERLKIIVPAPWSGFREDAFQSIQQIIVSHAVNSRQRGPLHQDTSYGWSNSQSAFVTRKKLDPFITLKQIDSIVDPVVRDIVRSRLDAAGGNPKKAFADTFNEPVFHQDGKTPIHRVRISDSGFNRSSMLGIKDRLGAEYKFFPLESNHAVLILRDPISGKYDIDVRTTLEATRQSRSSKQTIEETRSENREIVMSLAHDDMVEFEDDQLGRNVFRVQKFSESDKSFEITLRLHTSASTEKGSAVGEVRIQSKKRLGQIRKVFVSPLGEISRQNDKTSG